MPTRRATLDIQKPEHLARQLGMPMRALEFYMKNSEQQHYEKREQKKSGGIRLIEPPFENRKALQRAINKVLKRVILPDFFHGSVPGKTHITNAAPHCGKPLVQKFDLRNFFPSVTSKMVERMFREQLRCSPDVARILTRLTTFRGHVPQGSPTSSLVACLVLVPAACRMKALADKHGWDFTVYVDDLTFSGPLWLENFKSLLVGIAESHGFSVNHEKSIPLPATMEQTVTGTSVNRAVPGITRENRDELFSELSRLELEYVNRCPPKREVQSLIGKIYAVNKLNSAVVHDLLGRASVRRWRKQHKV